MSDDFPADFLYIERYYGVKAHVGTRVIADGDGGEIVGADGQYLLIRLDGKTGVGRYHPTWHMEIVDDPEPERCGWFDCGHTAEEHYRSRATKFQCRDSNCRCEGWITEDYRHFHHRADGSAWGCLGGDLCKDIEVD